MSKPEINNTDYKFYLNDEDDYVVHMLTSKEQTFLTNAYLIETRHSLIAVDTFMVISDANLLIERVKLIDKPLVAIIITHAHPDHYNGTATLIENNKNLPIISFEHVAIEIARSFEDKKIKWQSVFKEDWPQKIVMPNTFVSNDQKMSIDGLDFHFKDLGEAESNGDLLLTIGINNPMVFAGDIVFNNVHSYMNNGHSERWLKVLIELRSDLSSHTTLFTGHGKPGLAEQLINKQIDYIKKYRETIFSLKSDNRNLNDMQKDELYNIINETFPQYKLTVFIKAGADAVSNELIR